MTLYGKNFGSSGYTQGVQIGDTKIDASNVQWTSDSSMVALMPPGRGVNLDVIVFQSDSVELPFSDSPRDRRGSGMLTGVFTFDSPAISSVRFLTVESKGLPRFSTVESKGFPRFSTVWRIAGKPLDTT